MAALPFAFSGERAANLAVRSTVDVAGKEAPRSLYEHFDRMNAEFFENKLKPALILLTPPSSPRCYGDYAEQDAHGLRTCIRIRPSLVGHPEDPDNLFAKDVLLHEMVHAYGHEFAGQPERSYRGHGPTFAAKCNEIGATLRLPEVFIRTKKNKDKPLCNYWPHVVRPDGFYPWNPEKKTAAAKTALTATTERHSAELERVVLLLGKVGGAIQDMIDCVNGVGLFIEEHEGPIDKSELLDEFAAIECVVNDMEQLDIGAILNEEPLYRTVYRLARESGTGFEKSMRQPATEGA